MVANGAQVENIVLKISIKINSTNEYPTPFNHVFLMCIALGMSKHAVMIVVYSMQRKVHWSLRCLVKS